MLNAELFRLAWRVQRVRKQEESGDKLRFGGAEYSRLASTVGVPAEKNPPCDILTHDRNRIVKAGAIAFGVAREWWAGSPLMAEGQSAAQNAVSICGKGVAKRHQHRSRAIRTGAMRQDQGVAVGIRGRVQEAADSGSQ